MTPKLSCFIAAHGGPASVMSVAGSQLVVSRFVISSQFFVLLDNAYRGLAGLLEAPIEHFERHSSWPNSAVLSTVSRFAPMKLGPSADAGSGRHGPDGLRCPSGRNDRSLRANAFSCATGEHRAGRGPCPQAGPIAAHRRSRAPDRCRTNAPGLRGSCTFCAPPF